MRSRLTLRRTRSVHMIIATSMLTVPASALAFTGATSETGQAAANPPVQTTLNVHVSPRRVKFGDAVTIKGTAPGTHAGRRVLIQTALRREGRWRPLATAQINRSGGFRVRAMPRRSGLVRAVEQSPAAEQSPAGTVSTTTPVSTLSVAPVAAQPAMTVGARFTEARHESAVLSTRPVRVGGKLLPAAAGRRVRLQSHGSRGWRTLSTGRTGVRGGYRLSFAPGAADGQRLRVVFGGDRRNARAVRSAGTVRVLHPALASWYNDAGMTACGFHAGLGIANRALPCGTRVTLHYGSRTVTAVVDDRGPYVGGRDWDLNQTTAAALGFGGVGTVWYSS
ncbi:MAG: septal ring lytic transglycosylase RlpA family protein [Solirubrobacteraceae bacterium]